MSSQRLKDLFNTFQRLRDCLKVTRRAVRQGNLDLLDSTVFMGQSQTQAGDWIDQATEVANDLAIVALWAWFERYMTEYAQTRASEIASIAQPGFDQQLQGKMAENIESWRPDEVLDVFKSIIHADQIGHAKNIKKYRDYIAHRNPNRLPPAQAEPTTVYALFLAIINAVEEASAAD